MSELDKYTIRQPHTAELDQVQRIRHDALDPARAADFDVSLSDVDHDPRTVHMAAFDGEQLVSTVRLGPVRDSSDAHYEVRKMATAEEYRRRGIGASVLRAAEHVAVGRGARMLWLDAREDAVSFYTHQGYQETGNQVVHDDGVPNFRMFKRVNP